jgi:hypothetical protein
VYPFLVYILTQTKKKSTPRFHDRFVPFAERNDQFYELKSFWSFGKYMLRSKNGIENFICIASLAYSSAKLIPFHDAELFDFAYLSPQTFKFALGEAIRNDLFFSRFVDFIENSNISFNDLSNIDLQDFINFSA